MKQFLLTLMAVLPIVILATVPTARQYLHDTLVNYMGKTGLILFVMTPGQARVIDPVLSNVARGYKNAQLVGGFLFPTVQVAQRAGKVIQFGKESFRLYDTARAPGTAVKRVSIGYGNQNFSLVDHSLAAIVPQELLEEASAVPGVDLAAASMQTVLASMSVRLEYEQAQLATNAANYAASNKITLSGTDQFNDPASDPVAVILDAREDVRAKTGVYPNTLEIPAQVFSVLKRHPKIIDRIKYTGRDVPTVELLASLFEVDRVVIGSAVISDAAGALSDIWGKSVVLAYTDISGVNNMGSPSFGYTYQLNGYMVASPGRWDADIRSWLYDITDASQPVIAGSEAGYLISAAIA